jgi:hypothetical protein
MITLQQISHILKVIRGHIDTFYSPTPVREKIFEHPYPISGYENCLG